MVSLTIDLPEEAFSALRVDRAQFAKELRFAAAVQWYHQGVISGSKAAEIAGMTRLEFPRRAGPPPAGHRQDRLR